MNEITLQGNAEPKTFLAQVPDCLNLMAFVMLQPKVKLVADSISIMFGDCKSAQGNLVAYPREQEKTK